MSTTTLRIEPVLRQRITQLAHALNQTPHNFMLEALAEKAGKGVFCEIDTCCITTSAQHARIRPYFIEMQ